MGIFIIYLSNSSHSIFSPFWREHFGRLGEKTLGSHQFFSLPSLQPNTHQKSFISHFLSKIFHPPYFTSKRTYPDGFTLKLRWSQDHPGLEKKSLLYIKFKNFIIFLTLKKMCDHPKFLLGPI